MRLLALLWLLVPSLVWSEDLIQTFRSGSLDSVKKAIETGALVETRFEENGQVTPLMYASRYNSVEVVAYLLKVGAKVDDRDAVGWTALNWALVGGKFDNAALLEKAGTKLAVQAKNPGSAPDLVEVKPSDTLDRKAEIDRWSATLTASNADLESDKLDRILEELRLLKLQVAELEGRLPMVASSVAVRPAELQPATTLNQPAVVQFVGEPRPFPAYIRVQSSTTITGVLANDLLPDGVLFEQLNDLWFEPKENALSTEWTFRGIKVGFGIEGMKIRVPGAPQWNGWYGWTSTPTDKTVYWPYAHLGLEVGSWLNQQWYQSLDTGAGLSPWSIKADAGYSLKYHWTKDFSAWARVAPLAITLMPSETAGSQVFGLSVTLGVQAM